MLNNPGALVLLVVFSIGAAFFAAGTALVRHERLGRIDVLLQTGDEASVRELEELRDRGPSKAIRDAAEDALLVIATRVR